jgi:arylsulfatase A-like enzyme
MFWLAPDAVPTVGDWFRTGGYRTFYKGKWHASHAHLDADDGEGYLLSIDDDGTPIEDNIQRYLEADLLDDYGFSEWVGPEPHWLGKHNTGTLKDPFTADETVALLKRVTVTEPEPEEYELYDLTLDPIEERNLAHPSFADDRSRVLQRKMLGLLIEQLDAKRLTPSTGETPGYVPPAIA